MRDERTDRQPRCSMPLNFFEVGGIKNEVSVLLTPSGDGNEVCGAGLSGNLHYDGVCEDFLLCKSATQP